MRTRASELGLSLVEMIVTLGVAGIVGVMLITQFRNITDVQKSLTIRRDLADIRGKITKSVDCNATLSPYRAARTGFINPGKVVVLRTKAGKALTGANAPSGKPLSGGVQIDGPWYARARWNGTSISLWVAKKGDENFGAAIDPLSGETLDYDHPATELFSATPGTIPLCAGDSDAGYLARSERFTSNDLLAAVGMSAPQGSRTVSYLARSPLGLTVGCHVSCQGRGYRAGWPLEYSDTYAIYDSENRFVGEGDYADGMSAVWCGCIR